MARPDTQPSEREPTEQERVLQGVVQRLLDRNAQLTLQVAELDVRYGLLLEQMKAAARPAAGRDSA